MDVAEWLCAYFQTISRAKLFCVCGVLGSRLTQRVTQIVLALDSLEPSDETDWMTVGTTVGPTTMAAGRSPIVLQWLRRLNA